MEKNIFIKNNIEKLSRGEYTDFLDPLERKTIISKLNKLHLKYNEYIPFKGAEKTIIYTNTYPSISLIKIKCKSILKHNDILGCLFAHQINTTKYGDIIVGDNYYILILDSIKRYVLTNINKIGRYNVELEEVDLSIIDNYELAFDDYELLVSSLRLDSIVSSITGMSRKQVEEYLADKLVLVNYEIITKKTYIMHPGDVISVRRYGKYIYDDEITVSDEVIEVQINNLNVDKKIVICEMNGEEAVYSLW